MCFVIRDTIKSSSLLVFLIDLWLASKTFFNVKEDAKEKKFENEIVGLISNLNNMIKKYNNNKYIDKKTWK
jgi:hypothetical protein